MLGVSEQVAAMNQTPNPFVGVLIQKEIMPLCKKGLAM